MNRKSFIQSFLPLGMAAFASTRLWGRNGSDTDTAQIIPPYLKPGDTVAITCPAGPMELANMQSCIKTLKSWGLQVQCGKTVGRRWERFGGTDAERLADFQALLDNNTIKAIIFGKGGYGTMRIIDGINWDRFKATPKWLVGYSDLTTVHLHVHSNLNIPTIHGDMTNGFSEEKGDLSVISLYDALFGRRVDYHLQSGVMNRQGSATGVLVGGNLSLLQACTGSKSDIDTRGKILFIEDVSEYKYTIDRMLMSLKRSGKLSGLAGLIVGSFTAVKADSEETFNQRIEDIVYDKVKEYHYPVCFHFPAGHIKHNRAIKLGLPYELVVGASTVWFKEVLPSLAPAATGSVVG